MRITKKLFEYLDSFTFTDDSEKVGAICDFFKLECPFYSELARASEICDTYNEYLRLKSENMKIDRKILKTL